MFHVTYLIRLYPYITMAIHVSVLLTDSVPATIIGADQYPYHLQLAWNVNSTHLLTMASHVWASNSGSIIEFLLQCLRLLATLHDNTCSNAYPTHLLPFPSKSPIWKKCKAQFSTWSLARSRPYSIWNIQSFFPSLSIHIGGIYMECNNEAGNRERREGREMGRDTTDIHL
jgi:hypothetical protein